MSANCPHCESLIASLPYHGNHIAQVALNGDLPTLHTLHSGLPPQC